VCRRISAVGTQIAANAFWLNYPCAASVAPPPSGPVYPPNLASPANGGVYNDGKYTVTEANLIPDMRSCVAQYNNSASAADNFAIGLLFTDNNPSTESFAWDYLSIDGTAPNVPNAVSGAYKFVTTETLQFRNRSVNGVPPLSSDALRFNLVSGLTTLLSDPRVLAVQPGFLALPEYFTPNVHGKNVWRGTTNGPNVCSPPVLYY
jgi:hypothetical protein